MTTRVEIDPGWSWDDKFSYAQAVKEGNLLYISGQVALDPKGNLVGRGDMRAQSQQVFANIEAILTKAGGTPDSLIKITAYLTDMTRYGDYNEARGEFFRGRRPASTTIQVPALAFDGLLVEVEAVASLG